MSQSVLTGLTAAILCASATPAWAYEPAADMGYAFELSSWSAAAPAGQSVGFLSAMHTVTLADRTGIVMALFTSVAKTEGNRYAAEQSARSRDEQFYSYQQHIDEPKDGVRLGLVLGTGGQSGTYAPGITGALSDTDAKLARVSVASDLFELPLGTLAFQTGVNFFQAAGKDTTGATFKFTTYGLPLGVTWRLAPLPINGLVFEPFADFDWVQAFSKKLAGDAGIRVNYYLHPRFALQGRLELAKWASDGTGLNQGDLADARTASAGATLLF